MKLSKKNIIATALLALFPFAAFADSHFYVGGSVGSATLSEDFDGFDVDSSSTAFRLVAGWQFNDYFSLEGGYHNFGTFDQQFDISGEMIDVSLKADGFLLGGTATIPVGQDFAVFGRMGSFFWDGDADINNVTQATPEDTNLYLSAGVRFAISERVAIQGDWTRYKLEDTQSDVASIGVLYRF